MGKLRWMRKDVKKGRGFQEEEKYSTNKRGIRFSMMRSFYQLSFLVSSISAKGIATKIMTVSRKYLKEIKHGKNAVKNNNNKNIIRYVKNKEQKNWNVGGKKN